MPSHLSPSADARAGALDHTAGSCWVRLLGAHEYRADAAVVAVHGEIDLGSAPLLREVLLPVIERQTGTVVVDLSAVGFMDSTGVHVLVETLQRLRLENRRLAVACREGGQVHRVLGLVGLLDAVAVHRSREGALIGSGDRLRFQPDRHRARSAALRRGSRSAPPGADPEPAFSQPASGQAPQAP